MALICQFLYETGMTMLHSGILGMYQSVSGRSMIQYVCLEGVSVICSSRSLS